MLLNGRLKLLFDKKTQQDTEPSPVLDLYYLQSRYYDSNTGRFLNADGFVTTGQGVLSYNMFAYCGNNPVMLCDPSGCCAAATIVLAGIGAAVSAISVASNVPKITDGHTSPDDLTDEQMHQNAELIYDILSRKGWSHNAICAVLGNAQLESITINPGKYQDDGPGYGIVQWDPAEKYLNSDYAKGYGATSLIGQVEFLNCSMQPGYGEWFEDTKHAEYYLAYDVFITSDLSVSYLTEVFLWSYERPSVTHLDERIAYAQYWDNYFS